VGSRRESLKGSMPAPIHRGRPGAPVVDIVSPLPHGREGQAQSLRGPRLFPDLQGLQQNADSQGFDHWRRRSDRPLPHQPQFFSHRSVHTDGSCRAVAQFTLQTVRLRPCCDRWARNIHGQSLESVTAFLEMFYGVLLQSLAARLSSPTSPYMRQRGLPRWSDSRMRVRRTPHQRVGPGLSGDGPRKRLRKVLNRVRWAGKPLLPYRLIVHPLFAGNPLVG